MRLILRCQRGQPVTPFRRQSNGVASMRPGSSRKSKERYIIFSECRCWLSRERNSLFASDVLTPNMRVFAIWACFRTWDLLFEMLGC